MKAPMQVEYFGIDFGIIEGYVCTKCGEEYLTDKIWQEIEDKARGLVPTGKGKIEIEIAG